MIQPNRIVLLGLLLSLAGVLSCVFDDTQDASAWMEKTGVPSSVKTDMVLIDGIHPDSTWLVRDTLPYVNKSTLALGEANGLRQELFIDMLTHAKDSAAIAWLQAGDTSWAQIRFTLDSTFYAKMVSNDSFPLQEGLTARFAWNLVPAMSKAMVDSLVLSNADFDSLALNAVRGKQTWDSVSAPLVLDLAKRNSSFTLDLPEALQAELRKAKAGNFYLQLRVSFVRADRIYRLAGANSKYNNRPTLLFQRTLKDSTSTYTGLKDSTGIYTRVVQAGYVTEASESNVLLHGGVAESLYVSIPQDLVWKAIQEQLNDDLALHPEHKDSIYSSRFVLLASMDFASDQRKAPSELGLPLLVYSYSVVDTIEEAGVIGFTEATGTAHEPRSMIDSANIPKYGRANSLFWSGRDSVQLQVTNSVRYWMQSKYYGAQLKAKFNISSWPLRDPKRYNTSSYYDADSNIVEVVSGYPAYSRWDMGLADSLKFRLRIWLTEKR